jgi:hypothetical protein
VLEEAGRAGDLLTMNLTERRAAAEVDMGSSLGRSQPPEFVGKKPCQPDQTGHSC